MVLSVKKWWRKLVKKRVALKVFNPFIWLVNWFSYDAHLRHWAELERAARKRGGHAEYEPYDFAKDLKYF